MRKYKCALCGFLYDEEIEFVKFCDLGSCPNCDCGKDMFVFLPYGLIGWDH